MTGDRAVCEEATSLLGPGLTTVAVKEGIGSHGARQVPALRARELIEDGAKRALQKLDAVAPYDPGRPCEIEVEFTTSDAAKSFMRRPGVETVDPRKIRVRADDWWSAWRAFFL